MYLDQTPDNLVRKADIHLFPPLHIHLAYAANLGQTNAPARHPG